MNKNQYFSKGNDVKNLLIIFKSLIIPLFL